VQCKEEMMSIEVAGSLMDHEARYEYLSQLDEAWEVCRCDVEMARAAYETALERSRAAYEERLAAAGADHGRRIDDAWATYRTDVQRSRPEDRREAIADARRAYAETVASIRGSYNDALAQVKDEHSTALRAARGTYEEAVEAAFGSHRDAVHLVHHYLEPGDGHDLGSMTPEAMELAAEEARTAGDAGPTSDPVTPPPAHPAVNMLHPMQAVESDDAGFIDWMTKEPAPAGHAA
jgi:hypothetical protein